MAACPEGPRFEPGHEIDGVLAEFSAWLDNNRLQLFDLYHKMEMCCRPEHQKAFRDVSEALALNLFVENKPNLFRVVF
jgi:hypothetical protein